MPDRNDSASFKAALLGRSRFMIACPNTYVPARMLGQISEGIGPNADADLGGGRRMTITIGCTDIGRSMRR
jgi:hypothetical protein